jgi:hypothetical protein
MQFFLAQVCRGEALQSEDWPSKEKILSEFSALWER